MDGPPIARSRYPDPLVPQEDLAEFTLSQAGCWPHRTALIDGATGASWTYQELVAGVRLAASRFAALDLGANSRVGLAAANQPAWAVAFYGGLAAGATVVPLNPALRPAELRRLLAVSRPKAVVADPSALPALSEALAPPGVPAVPGGPALVTLSALVSEQFDPASGEPDPARDGRSGEEVPEVSRASPDPASVAVLAFSSGTTGPVKGVRLTHANLVSAVVQHEPVYHVGPGDVFLAAMPLFHIYGMSIVLGYGLRHGATVVTMPRFDIDTYCSLVGEHRVTWLHLVPPMAHALATRPAGRDDLSSVRHAVCGAAPLDAGVAAEVSAVLGCEVGQGYGMTEASPGVTWVPDDGSVRCPPGSVGVLVPGTEARLVDPVTGAGAGDAGELWVRGPQVMSGYLDDPEATAAALTPDGWLRTGDVLRVDGDGVWWVVDRLKELIKVKGWQVAPAELEALLLEHPDVADAAVAGRLDPESGEVPVAWVVSRRPVGRVELMAWLAERVAPYKRVRRVHLVDSIPRSPSGKVLRRDLVEPP